MEISYTMHDRFMDKYKSPYNFKVQGAKKEQDEEKIKQDNENQKVLKFLTERMNKVKEQIAKLKCDETKSLEEKQELMKELKQQLKELNETYMLKRLSIQEEEQAKRAEEQKKLEEQAKKEKSNQEKTQEEASYADTKEVSKALVKAGGMLKQNKQLKVIQSQMEFKSAFLQSQIEKDISRGIVPDEKIEEQLDVEKGIQSLKDTIAKGNKEAIKEVNEASKAEKEEDKEAESKEVETAEENGDNISDGAASSREEGKMEQVQASKGAYEAYSKKPGNTEDKIDAAV